MGARRSRSPAVAALLSAILPGLGQCYNRQWGKGAGFLAGLLGLSIALTSVVDPAQLERAAATGAPLDNLGSILILLLLLLALVLWSIVDALRSAKRTQA